MHICLDAVSIHDGIDIYEMLQEIPRNENGFQNEAWGIKLADFPAYLAWRVKLSDESQVLPHQVAQTCYWLRVDGIPVGMSRLYHELDATRQVIGHLAYAIRPSRRNAGFGTLLLQRTLQQASLRGIDPVVIACRSSNLVSVHCIQKAGGIKFEANTRRKLFKISVSATPNPVIGDTEAKNIPR